MTKKNNKFWALWTVVLLVGALAISVSVFAWSSTSAPKYLAQDGGTINVNEAQDNIVGDEVNNPGEEELGGISSDFNQHWITVGGVRLWQASEPLITASSTLCNLQAPAATSTLIHGSLNILTGTTTALYLEFGKGASGTNTSTTTSLGIISSLAANAFGTFIASTTQSGADPANVFAPNTWFIAKMAAQSYSYYDAAALTGRCKAIWMMNTTP